MQTITVHTTQNIDIDYEIGGLGERIVARLIDDGIFIPFFLGGIFIVTSSNIAGLVYFIILAVIYVFYNLLCEIFFNGQSFGKRVMKIRVISLNGNRPKFSQYLLRWLFRLVDFSLSGGLAALISAAITTNGQRVGDIVADTALIRTIPRAKADNLIYTSTENTYQPVFTGVTQLTDTDISLIHEVINSYVKTGNETAVYTLADRIREYLQINLPPNMNSMQFLQTLLKDYSHINAHADLV